MRGCTERCPLACSQGVRLCIIESGIIGQGLMNQRNEKIDQTTWFASYAPYDKPRYVVVVMVESGASGGATWMA